MQQTLYDKIWQSHTVRTEEDGTILLYIDRHLVHEVTSPQAFEGLRLAHRALWRKDSILATPDHNIPTKDLDKGIADPISREQVAELDKNCESHHLNYLNLGDVRQGIVHVIGPEQGAILPGTTVVCGDSHTATHGAFAALAFGIGTSEVEHVMASQTLSQKKAKNMRINITGTLADGVTAKDLVLYVIGQIGTAGGTGYTIEFAGQAIRSLSMEGRMTVCNMAIEAGARAGLIGVDEQTIAYLQDRPMSPKGVQWSAAVQYWQTLCSDADAIFDHEHYFDAAQILPQVSWGTSPEMVCDVNGHTPLLEQITDANKRAGVEKALQYMGLSENTPVQSIALDKIFIGSCTNSRIEDLRAAAQVVKGKKLASNIKQALVVPGSGLVKQQAEQEGLHQIFIDAGFEWRSPGCSMCLGMNDDRINAGEHCASTSNRNFEGRQGAGGRTHLVSPIMAAAAAIAGHFVDVRKLTPTEA